MRSSFRRAVLLYLQLRLPVEVVLLLAAPGVAVERGCLPAAKLDGPAFLHRLMVWDAGWYVTIIQDGYRYLGPGQQASIAFYPLYPMLAKGLMFLGLPMTVSLVLVSHLALIFALAALFALASATSRFNPERAAIGLLLFPTAFFTSAAYTEALFIALSLWGLWAVELRKWWLAGLIAGALVLCRANGLTSVAAMGVLALLRRDGRSVAAMAVGSLAALGGYMLFQGVVLGEPLAFLKVRGSWLGSGLSYVTETWQGIHAIHGWLDVLTIPWLAITGYVAWRKLGPAYAVMVWGTLALPLAVQQVWSFSRIALSAVPSFLVLGTRWLPAWLLRTLLVFSTCMFAINAYRLVHCHWVS